MIDIAFGTESLEATMVTQCDEPTLQTPTIPANHNRNKPA
jgi:hypothetical protein